MSPPAFVRLVEVFEAPRERVVAAWAWRWVAGMPDTRKSLVTVEFRDLGGRTEVVLRHDTFAGPGPVDMYDAGRAGGLENLGAHPGGEA